MWQYGTSLYASHKASSPFNGGLNPFADEIKLLGIYITYTSYITYFSSTRRRSTGGNMNSGGHYC